MFLAGSPEQGLLERPVMRLRLAIPNPLRIALITPRCLADQYGTKPMFRQCGTNDVLRVTGSRSMVNVPFPTAVPRRVVTAHCEVFGNFVLARRRRAGNGRYASHGALLSAAREPASVIHQHLLLCQGRAC